MGINFGVDVGCSFTKDIIIDRNTVQAILLRVPYPKNFFTSAMPTPAAMNPPTLLAAT